MECALTSTAAGAWSRPGSTSYSSLHRYQDMRISGRTPRTVSAPAAKLSHAAAVCLTLSSARPVPVPVALPVAAPLVERAAPFVRSLAPFIPSPFAVGEERSRIVIAGRTYDVTHRPSHLGPPSG